eukprot:5706047-Pyramimonas_sp.AAC.1
MAESAIKRAINSASTTTATAKMSGAVAKLQQSSNRAPSEPVYPVGRPALGIVLVFQNNRMSAFSQMGPLTDARPNAGAVVQVVPRYLSTFRPSSLVTTSLASTRVNPRLAAAAAVGPKGDGGGAHPNDGEPVRTRLISRIQ